MRAILRAALSAGGPQPAPLQPTASPAQTRAPPRRAAPILLIISGGIAAYKALDLIRRLRSAAIACAR